MKYYVRECGENTADAVDCSCSNFCEPLEAAKVAASAFFEEVGDTYGWPLIITIVKDDGEEIEFSVDVSYPPVFPAMAVKPIMKET
jgi:hypothetical protein